MSTLPPHCVLAPTHATSPCSSPAAHHWAFITACTMSPCPSRLCSLCCLAPRGCTHHIALPLATGFTASPCPLQLHTPHRCGPCPLRLHTPHRHGPCPSRLHALHRRAPC